MMVDAFYKREREFLEINLTVVSKAMRILSTMMITSAGLVRLNEEETTKLIAENGRGFACSGDKDILNRIIVCGISCKSKSGCEIVVQA